MDNYLKDLITNFHRIKEKKNELLEEKSRFHAIEQDLDRKIADLKKENQEKQKYIDDIKNSRSWKIINKTSKILHPKKQPEPEIKTETTKPQSSPCDSLPKSYISHYEDNVDFSKYKTDIKPIAFYLPQFHTFPENDKWWGKGFTEWTNTRPSLPRFPGHYQPREPHDDFGYYTLDNKETIKKQITLAKQHGIYGFCLYYYWFSGKQLMTKPLDIILENKDLKIPFCLCWANENWSRKWNGKSEDVLIYQKYTKNDPKQFIIDIKKYLKDSRYITIDGKPLILIYNPSEIPDFEQVVASWKETAKKEGIGEIVVWAKNNIFDDTYNVKTNIDGEFDFAPNCFNLQKCGICNNKEGLLYDYKKIVDILTIENIYGDHSPLNPFYYSVTMGWDNAARRKDIGFTVFSNYSPKAFYDWTRLIMDQTRKRNPKNKRFIFINAWNEWAEGTYLEPDKKYGYTNINTLSRAIFDLPYNSAKKDS